MPHWRRRIYLEVLYQLWQTDNKRALSLLWGSMNICHSVIPWSFLYLSYFRKKESVGECIFRWHEMILLGANTWPDLYIFNYWNSSFHLLAFLHNPLLKTSKPHPIICSCCSVVRSSWQPLCLAWAEIISSRHPSSSIAAPSGMHDDLYWEHCHAEISIPQSLLQYTNFSLQCIKQHIPISIYISFISDVELECLVHSLLLRWNLWRQFSYWCMSLSFLTLLNKDQNMDRLSWQPAQMIKQFLFQGRACEVVRDSVLVIRWMHLLVTIFFISFCSQHL